MKKEKFTIPHNFGALPFKHSQHDKARAVIIPFPYEQTVSYKTGTKDGPRAIIEASKNLELYDEELDSDIFKMGIHTLDEIEPSLGNPEEMLGEIFSIVLSEIKEGKFTVILGGEHSLTAPCVRAHKEKYKNLSVLQLDAHADLRDSYLGSKYSHASVMRRVLVDTPLVQAGIRSLSREEIDFVRKEQRKIYFAKEFVTDRNSWEKIISALTEEVYLTLDLDVLDPSIMPSVGTPEPGGMGWYDVLEFLFLLSKEKKIVGFDVVELSPIPGNIAPDFLAAKLVYKLLGYIFKKEKTKVNN
jgi:agmatinase